MTEISLIDVEEQPTVGVRRVVRVTELAAFFDTVFTELIDRLRQAGVQPVGAPFARYRGMPTDVVDIEAGFPVTESFPASGDLVAGALPAARAIEAVHVGPYDQLRETYARIEAWAAEHHLEPIGDMWERYESGPASHPDPATWRTRILWPVSAPQVEAGAS